MFKIDFIPFLNSAPRSLEDCEKSFAVPCGIISMMESLDRRTQMARTGVPADWIENFFEGADLRHCAPEKLADIADMQSFERRYGRAPTSGEIGCAVSHHRFLSSFLEGGADIALVFEDDLLPGDNFFSQLENLASDLIPIARMGEAFVCNIGLPEGFLYTHHLRPIWVRQGGARRSTSIFTVARKQDPVWRANAYFISRAAAQNILASERKIDRLADDWTSRWLDGSLNHIFVTEPPIALQDECTVSTLELDRRILVAKSVHRAEGYVSRKWQKFLRARARIERFRKFEVVCDKGPCVGGN